MRQELLAYFFRDREYPLLREKLLMIAIIYLCSQIYLAATLHTTVRSPRLLLFSCRSPGYWYFYLGNKHEERPTFQGGAHGAWLMLTTLSEAEDEHL